MKVYNIRLQYNYILFLQYWLIKLKIIKKDCLTRQPFLRLYACYFLPWPKTDSSSSFSLAFSACFKIKPNATNVAIDKA